MTSGVAYSPKEIEDYQEKIIGYLLAQPGGTFAGACNSHKIPVATAYGWRKQDEAFDRAVIEARKLADENGGDLAEAKLIQAINQGELTAIIFYLKTKHKHRGFVEKTQMDHGLRDDVTEEDREILERFFSGRKDG